MSASLVGSEMCIRDSALEFRPSRGEGRAPGAGSTATRTVVVQGAARRVMHAHACVGARAFWTGPRMCAPW
eukprot:10383809-Alexandrium_andersonii.AAC.1